jgi:hypothetical protein
MPGVNRICNTKMSQTAAYFELFLRHAAALRNFLTKLARLSRRDAPGRKTQAIRKM